MSKTQTNDYEPFGFFRFASEIMRDPQSDEAAYRTAISRGYYAIYLTARNRVFGTDDKLLTNAIKKRILKEYNQQKSKRRQSLATHERLIFAISTKTKNITLKQRLDQLKEARVHADYHCDQGCLSKVGKQSWFEYAKETMELATLVLPTVQALPSY